MSNFFKDFFSLHNDQESKRITAETVKNNISFRGANVWTLACAIIVASVGLNVNSSAVIIGAMLISPLMGPIVGAGFALGVYDFELLKKSLKNLLIATLVSLLVSSFYFFLSPFKEAQSELLARTSPNIYDVLIAFFGGLVGIVAITRSEKGNAVAGVAIATALMPPLCTAGFAFATTNWRFFFGAMFLYTINCVFICIASFIIIKYLKFPLASYVNEKNQKKIRYGLTAIIMVILIPSGYFAYTLYKSQEFKQRVEKFIKNEFTDKGMNVVYKKSAYNRESQSLDLAFLRAEFSGEEIRKINDRLKKYDLEGTKLRILQNDSSSLQAFRNDILNEVSKRDIDIDNKEKKIEELEKALLKDSVDNLNLYREIKTIYPNIRSSSLGFHRFYTQKDSLFRSAVFLYDASPALTEIDKEKLKNFIETRLSLKDLKLQPLSKP